MENCRSRFVAAIEASSPEKHRDLDSLRDEHRDQDSLWLLQPRRRRKISTSVLVIVAIQSPCCRDHRLTTRERARHSGEEREREREREREEKEGQRSHCRRDPVVGARVLFDRWRERERETRA
ncbi:hypothetical protein TIFTF001_003940 [Ficus carica]|uniref:Uncharacterized protein n=1 Tax=Ficus carica TaxID=3494 RepID=A0AA87Z9Z1_FICCA|nr:hypothetical protein TIFTF001_003940 [Ficus carica]